MSSSRAALRARAVWVGLGLAGCLSGATGCHRSSLSSFVPSLRVQLSALRSAEGTSASRDRVSWDVAVTGWLRFQPKIAASAVPLRAEWAPEAALAPCAEDDLLCLEEFAEGEHEASALLGELQ
jgi:hypothetical protein